VPFDRSGLTFLENHNPLPTNEFLIERRYAFQSIASEPRFEICQTLNKVKFTTIRSLY
jgi:hypothetical protein